MTDLYYDFEGIYYIAQLYAVAEASKKETGGGEGLEVLENEEFDTDDPARDDYNPDDTIVDGDGTEYKTGQYTEKIYHMKDKVPRFVRLFAPKGSLEFREKAWNAFPYIRTVITNGYMDKNFTLKIETIHRNDRGETHNAHGLTEEQLSKREVVHIDIANDTISPSDYNPDEDPALYRSKKLQRGPLNTKDWKKTVSPVMCCYKLLTAEFKWLGLQTRVEAMMFKQEQRIFTNFHRQLFCWTDIWADMTLQQIRDVEDRTKEELDQQRKHGPMRGTLAS